MILARNRTLHAYLQQDSRGPPIKSFAWFAGQSLILGTKPRLRRCLRDPKRTQAMNRLGIYLTVAIGAMVTAGLLFALLSLGWYS